MTTAEVPDLRVVLADDSAESRVLLRSMLDAVTGIEVVGVASDGRQAVDSVRATGPDAVFLDIAMPVMDGLQAATAIRATRPEVKIIMYSGYDTGSAGASALSAGADDYLQKAFTLDQLVGQLRHVFPGHVLDAVPGVGGHPPRPTGEQQGLLVGDDFRAVVEALPDPVFVFAARRDAAGAVVELEYRYVNAAVLRLYGMRRDQVVGHGQLELFPSVRENGLWEKYLAVIESGEPASIQLPSFDENGVRGGFSLSVARFGDGLILTARDITAQLRTAQELAGSERRMREAFESMLDGVVILSPVRSAQGGIVDFRYEYINEAGCRLNRMPRERHLGQRLREVLPGFRGSGLFDDFVRVVQTGQPLQKRAYLYEDVFGGTHVLSRVWDISVVPFGDGIVDTFRDVTDQVTAEKERRVSQERLRGAVQTLKEGFFLTAARRDEDGRIVDLEYLITNAAGCAMARRAESEIVGHGYREIWPTVPAELFDHYCAVADTGVPYSTIVQGGPADGVVATYEVSVTQVCDGCAFVVDDVAERLRDEQQLADAHADAQRRAEQLERSNQELQVFAAAISHDLREPLRTTAGFAGLIRDRYAADLPAPARDLFGPNCDPVDRFRGERVSVRVLLVDDAAYVRRLIAAEGLDLIAESD